MYIIITLRAGNRLYFIEGSLKFRMVSQKSLQTVGVITFLIVLALIGTIVAIIVLGKLNNLLLNKKYYRNTILSENR